jgi:hypothetical protein
MGLHNLDAQGGCVAIKEVELRPLEERTAAGSCDYDHDEDGD